MAMQLDKIKTIQVIGPTAVHAGTKPHADVTN